MTWLQFKTWIAFVHIFLFLIEELILWIELPRPEIQRTPTHDIQEHWTAVSTLLGLISSVYHNLHHWRSNQRPQIAVLKLYNWATSSYRMWLVNLALLACDMNWWLSCRVSALQSVVAGSISSGGDYGIHCWWGLIRSKQLSSVPVCHA